MTLAILRFVSVIFIVLVGLIAIHTSNILPFLPRVVVGGLGVALILLAGKYLT